MGFLQLTEFHPIVIGLAVGLIFGAGITPATQLHTLQIRHTPSEFQARTVIFRHTTGGLGGFLLILIFSSIAQATKLWGLPFIAAGIIYAISLGWLLIKMPLDAPVAASESEMIHSQGEQG